jgi:predicted dehydrogenase
MAFALFAITSAWGSAPPLKIAVVGLVHGHAWANLTDILASKAVTLVGLSEPNPVLRDLAKRKGVSDALLFTDTVRMLDETKPDIVWGFVENNRHLEVVRACAKRGIHVILEKPLASTYADARAIRDVAHAAGIFVMTNYQMAWWPANAAAKRIVDSGGVGAVFRLHGLVGHGGASSEGPSNRVFFDWLTDPVANGGGALIDFGCYTAVWSLWYLGRPQTVFARAETLQPERFPKVDDNVMILLGYPGGSALIEASWDLPRAYQDLEIMGRKGTVAMNKDGVQVGQGRTPSHSVPADALPEEKATPAAYMANAIRTHQPPGDILGLDINVDVMEILDAAQRSIRSGSVVRFSESGGRPMSLP